MPGRCSLAGMRGIAVDLLRIGGLRGGEGILWNALLMGGGGVVMVVVGLVVERFCRIPPEDLEGGTAGPETRRGETKGEGEYAYRGD